MNKKSGLSHFILRALDGVSELKVLWKEWNVPTLVITSLTLQLILILAGPLRIQTRNGVIVVSIWLAYLMADWVAAQAVGLISRNPDDLYALWAQFLLLHLGGPDTITALALEDNNLWLRTGLHLAVQGYTTLGVLVRSIRTSKLWVPMVLMFLAGNIKYMERVSALFCGRLTKFDEDPYLYADAFAAYEPQIVFVGPPAAMEETEVEKVRNAFYFFHYYKGVYADRQIKFGTRLRSKRYFEWIKTSEDAFKVLELQFYFTYEAIFTKTRITQMRSWKILRPVVTLLSVGCLVIWCFSKKDDIESHTILITYSLLIGAIIVDILAIFRSQLSYWNIVNYSTEGSPIRARVYNSMLVLYNNRSWGKYWRKEDAPIWERRRRAFFRRWSESISQVNLLELVREKKEITWLEKVADFFDFNNALTAFKFETKKWFPDHMRDFIVEDLKCKSLWAAVDNSKASYICHAKGSYAYKRLLTSTNVVERWKNVHALFDVSKEYEYIFVHWHIITELYYCDETQISGVGSVEEQDRVEIYREISKTLSDYVMYLLLQQPVMMASIVSGNAKEMIEDLSSRIWELDSFDIIGSEQR